MNTRILLSLVLLSLFLSKTAVAQESGIDIVARHPGDEDEKALNITTEFEPEAPVEDYTSILIILAASTAAIILLTAFLKRKLDWHPKSEHKK